MRQGDSFPTEQLKGSRPDFYEVSMTSVESMTGSRLLRERDLGVLTRPQGEPLGGYSYLSLLRRSLLRLAEQWARGVLPGHRACSVKDKAEAERRWLAGDPFTRSDVEKAQNNYRCGSASCRPGDPMGCGAANSRMKAQQSAFVLHRWLDVEDARVIYGVLDTRGEPAEALASVLERAASVFDSVKASDKGDWYRGAESEGLRVGGFLWHLAAYRRQGRWIVRRWVFAGLRGEHSSRDLSAWSRRLSLGWKQRSATSSGGSGHFSGWDRVRGDMQAEVTTKVAAGVTRYELRRGGERVGRWAAKIIESHDAGARAWILDEAAISDPWYAEYARAFEGRAIWQSSRVSSSDPEWAAALKDPGFRRIRFSGSHLQRKRKGDGAKPESGPRRPAEGDIW